MLMYIKIPLIFLKYFSLIKVYVKKSFKRDSKITFI